MKYYTLNYESDIKVYGWMDGWMDGGVVDLIDGNMKDYLNLTNLNKAKNDRGQSRGSI
jgi:hypothetical protein